MCCVFRFQKQPCKDGSIFLPFSEKNEFYTEPLNFSSAQSEPFSSVKKDSQTVAIWDLRLSIGCSSSVVQLLPADLVNNSTLSLQNVTCTQAESDTLLRVLIHS